MDSSDSPLNTENAATNQPVARDPFRPDATDAFFAILAFALGFLFVRYVLLNWQGFGVTLFTVIYAASATYYMHRKGYHQGTESLFWLVTLLVTGLSYSLWSAPGLRPWRELFLFLTAIYYVAVTTGRTLLGRTSDWLPLDGLHALVVIPLGNFAAQVRSVAWLLASRATGRQKRRIPWPAIAGIVISMAALGLIMPMLLAADSGGFARLTKGLMDLLRPRFRLQPELMLQLVLALPVGAYIFALLAGSAHRRTSRSYSVDTMSGLAEQARILPSVTVHIVLAVVNVVYLLFILSQIPYFFSAFFGIRPEGWEIYSAYARDGFFELLRLGLINLALLSLANLGAKTRHTASALLKVLNTTLALMTVLLVATAMSKMFLYIAVYGLSMRRLLPCIFMLFMATICGAVIARQSRTFSLMRFAAFSGAVLLTLLSLMDPDAMVARYNAARYLNGTLPKFDVDILYTAGTAGVAAAEMLLERTNDPELRPMIHQYLDVMYREARWSKASNRDTLQDMVIRRKLQRDGT